MGAACPPLPGRLQVRCQGVRVLRRRRQTSSPKGRVSALYLFYSVHRYFGFRRAFGIDHFNASYRTMPFVRQGIFRYPSNGMYVFGFLLLWTAGLWFASVAGLAAALFNHFYIWVHYFATERPDMRRMYGDTRAGG